MPVLSGFLSNYRRWNYVWRTGKVRSQSIAELEAETFAALRREAIEVRCFRDLEASYIGVGQRVGYWTQLMLGGLVVIGFVFILPFIIAALALVF